MSAKRLMVGIALNSAGSAGPLEIARQVAAAERAGFSFALFDDGPGEPGAPAGSGYLDPIETAAFASAHTASIGLIATAAATHAEPYHLSNRLSSLDWGSSGRAGWLVTVDASADRARAYSAPPPEAEAARREADAVIDAARRLWDSWEDGALIADSATGRFLDNDKIHYTDVSGEFFAIRGPALMPRPRQGQIPVVARASDGLATADIVVVPADQARTAGGRRILAELNLPPLDAPGAGEELTAALRRLAEEADGVLLRPFGGEVGGVLAGFVLPALIADGILAPPGPGQTLRDQFGLTRPLSRYAADFPGARA
jgi:alkanesulfonate monooxygenase SsuD/methylene tetrahydromethanopterin reductase-like flavin-dependent oxidoreductase (luciferase family)